MLLVGCLSSAVVALQPPAGASPGQSALRPCAILTRDLVEPFVANKTLLDVMPPEEEPMRGGGGACEYGVVRLQVSPGPGAARTAPGKEWQAVSGAGEAAYFRSNRNQYAELMFWTRTHYLTLQVSVPSGSTADAIKPKVLTLANQVIAKLK